MCACTKQHTRFQWCVYIVLPARIHCPMHSCLSIIYESVNIIHLLLTMEYDHSLLEISNVLTQALDEE